MGFPERRLKTLRNFQKSGGVFKVKKDLKNCFAISNEFYNRVEAYVSIPEMKRVEKLVVKPAKQLVELNQADSLELVSVKGIGPFYAKQILKYRKELGGFVNYKQFAEIWGLENLEIQKLKQQTTIDTLYIDKTNINSVSLKLLKVHPYIN